MLALWRRRRVGARLGLIAIRETGGIGMLLGLLSAAAVLIAWLTAPCLFAILVAFMAKLDERAADLLQSDVDAVIISTPPRTHAELAIAAARGLTSRARRRRKPSARAGACMPRRSSPNGPRTGAPP